MTRHLAPLLLLACTVGLLVTTAQPALTQPGLSPTEDVTLSVTCLPASSFRVPSALEIQIRFLGEGIVTGFHSEIYSHGEGALEVSTNRLAPVHRAMHAEVVFAGPRLTYREYCASIPGAERVIRLKGRERRVSPHSSLHCRANGAERPFRGPQIPTFMTVPPPAAKGDGQVLFGGGGHPYSLRFLRDISIRAPATDEQEIEFLVD